MASSCPLDVIRSSYCTSNALVTVVSNEDYYAVVAAEDSDDACAWMVFVDPQLGDKEGLLEVAVAVAAVVSPAEVSWLDPLFLNPLSEVSVQVFEFLHLKSEKLEKEN